MNTLNARDIQTILATLGYVDENTFFIQQSEPYMKSMTELIRARTQSIRDTLLRASLTDVAVEETRAAA